jgi:poly-beta-1,6-N-acetyl-D-glucosamine synthase
VLFLKNQLTVGICAFNEEKNIGKLLANVLVEQNLPIESEILVVCSGCTDNTIEIANHFASQDSRVKIILESERKGKASAINKIFYNATGEVLLFISSDVLPYKASFQELLAKLDEPDVGIVSGNPIPVNDSGTLIGRVVKLMWLFHGHVFHDLNDAGLARHATEVFCIRKGIVEKIPEETVNDDAFIAVTAKTRGWLIKYSEKAKVSICGPKSFLEYFQQRRRVIFGHYQLRKLTGESPQYLVHLMPLHPSRTARLTFWLLTKSDLITLSTFLFTEFLVNVTAILDFAFGKAHFRWVSLSSTKTVSP